MSALAAKPRKKRKYDKYSPNIPQELVIKYFFID